MDSRDLQPSEPGHLPKVPIPPLQRRKGNKVLPQIKRRVSRACVSCRARKVRCNGGRPCCKNCVGSDRPCIYVDSRRDRLKVTTERNHDMIRFLKDLKRSVTEETSGQIDDFLLQVTTDAIDTPNAVSLQPQRFSGPVGMPGEADVPAEVSFNDGLDAVDEDLLESGDNLATGYWGQSSEPRWMGHLQHEIEHIREPPSKPNGPFGPSTDLSEATWNGKKQTDFSILSKASASTYYLDSDGIEVDNTVNPFELPSMEVVQRLCDCYMTTVQASFPVLSRVTFIDQLRRHCTSMMHGAPLAVPTKWLATANLVLAIGAKYSHLVEADWQADTWDHHLYYSRARILGSSGTDLFSNPDLLHIQTAALLAFYYLSVGRVNSAWVVTGVSLRLAHALGLHLRNEDQTATIEKKETLVRIWWSLYSLEGLLSTIVGRPSSIIEGNYSTPLPLPLTMGQLSDKALVRKLSRNTGTTPDASNNISATQEIPNSGSYLKSRVQIDVITQRAMAELYSVRAAAKSWTGVQEAISGLSEQLEGWSASLPPGLDFTRQNSDTSFHRERLLLEMHYLGTKILITRPRLYRRDVRLTNRLKAPGNFDRQTARACIGAAKAIASLLPDQCDPRYLYRTGPWWCIVHNLMQALVVLLLETVYGHASLSYREEILPFVRKLICWLRAMRSNNQIADRAYHIAISMLQSLAPQVDADVIDLLEIHRADSRESAAPNYGVYVTGEHERDHQFPVDDRNQQPGEREIHTSIACDNQSNYGSIFSYPLGFDYNNPLPLGSDSPEAVFFASRNACIYS